MSDQRVSPASTAPCPCLCHEVGGSGYGDLEHHGKPCPCGLTRKGVEAQEQVIDARLTELIEEVAEAADRRVDASRYSTEAFERASDALDAAKDALHEYVASIRVSQPVDQPPADDEREDRDLTPEELKELDDFGAFFKQLVEADFEAYKLLATRTINMLARELSRYRKAEECICVPEATCPQHGIGAYLDGANVGKRSPLNDVSLPTNNRHSGKAEE